MNCVQAKNWVRMVERGWWIIFGLFIVLIIVLSRLVDISLQAKVGLFIVIAFCLVAAMYRGWSVAWLQPKVTDYDNRLNALNSAGVVIVCLESFQHSMRANIKLRQLSDEVYNHLKKMGVNCWTNDYNKHILTSSNDPLASINTILSYAKSKQKLALCIRPIGLERWGFMLMNVEGNSVLIDTEECSFGHGQDFKTHNIRAIARKIAEHIVESLKFNIWIQPSGPVKLKR